MVGRMLILGFPRRHVSPGEFFDVEATSTIPVYLESFTIPASLADYFGDVQEVQIGTTKIGPLAFAFFPDNPKAAYATLAVPVRVRAGETITATVGSITGHTVLLRMAAVVRADGEVIR